MTLNEIYASRKNIADHLYSRNYQAAAKECALIKDDPIGEIYQRLIESVRSDTGFKKTAVDSEVLAKTIVDLLEKEQPERYTEAFETLCFLLKETYSVEIFPAELVKKIEEYKRIKPLEELAAFIAAERRQEDDRIMSIVLKNKRDAKRAKLAKICAIAISGLVIIGCVVASFFL